MIAFVTTSALKVEEAQLALDGSGVGLAQVNPLELPEPISMDLQLVVRAKVLDAFGRYRAPLICEHGALEIEALNGLPGCLSKVFYEQLQDEVCNLLPVGAPRTAVARSVIAYCDGRQIHLFEGEVRGSIAPAARGAHDYYYDRAFIPEGHTETFAEMDRDAKVRISHVKTAYDKLATFLAA